MTWRRLRPEPKTQGNQTVENLISSTGKGLEETKRIVKMDSGKNPHWMLTLRVEFIGELTCLPIDVLGLLVAKGRHLAYQGAGGEHLD